MKKFIRIYSDVGVSQFSLKCLLKEIENLSLDVKTISADEVISGSWQDDTSIFIVPGGRDLMYLKKLTNEGILNIKSYVEKGGSYLGVCAGAYFGSSFVEFDKGGELEVIGKRDLGFVNCRAIGPAYEEPKFAYENLSGARAIPLEYSSKKISTLSYMYFNGGCYFKSDEKMDVIGVYSDLKLPAIIKAKVKRGRAILSGLHLECSFEDIEDVDDNLSLLKSKIRETENIRKQVFKEILDELLIDVI